MKVVKICPVIYVVKILTLNLIKQLVIHHPILVFLLKFNTQEDKKSLDTEINNQEEKVWWNKSYFFVLHKEEIWKELKRLHVAL